jgi:threonine aldolase
MTETPSGYKTDAAAGTQIFAPRRDGADCQPIFARARQALKSGAIAAQPRGPVGMNFASDNGAGVAPPILDAILASSRVNAPAYGADDFTARAQARLAEIFERKASVFLVATGTGANALSLAALTAPWQAVFCHEEAHVIDDECGAPEFFTGGAKVVGVPGGDGKIQPAGLAETLARYPRGQAKTSQPGALSLSQATEAGTAYRPDEIAALAALARQAGMGVHMDGARFANVVAATGASPAALTWRAGVDVLSLGATKNGALACEAVIVFDPAKAAAMPYQRKRAGQTLSKGRFLGAQMEAWLAGDLWLELARRANGAARRLAEGLAAAPSVRLAFPVEANEVFVVAPNATLARWRAAGAKFYDWSTRSARSDLAPRTGETMARLVTSFETSEAEVDALLALTKTP